MIRCTLFDVDGTLIHSYPGIYNAYRFAFEQMQLDFPGEPFVRQAIGSSLPHAFEGLYGMGPATAQEAIRHYRAYYSARGRHEATTYPGIPDALRHLRASGYRIGTATLKNERFAAEMLKEFGILDCFDAVCGMDGGNTLTKSKLITRCMERLHARPEDTLLIGDSIFDAQGAEEAGVRFLPVTYGYGFQDRESLRRIHAVKSAAAPAEIPNLVAEIFRP